MLSGTQSGGVETTEGRENGSTVSPKEAISHYRSQLGLVELSNLL